METIAADAEIPETADAVNTEDAAKEAVKKAAGKNAAETAVNAEKETVKKAGEETETTDADVGMSSRPGRYLRLRQDRRDRPMRTADVINPPICLRFRPGNPVFSGRDVSLFSPALLLPS